MINNVSELFSAMVVTLKGVAGPNPFLAKIKFGYFFNTHFPKMLKMFASYLFWYQINFE